MIEIITNWYDIRNFFETKTLLIFGFILLIALTALFCSKAGIVNLALEGQLIMGVFGFVLFGWIVKGKFTGESTIYLKTFISILGAFLFVTIITFIFSFMTITLKIDQILVGIGINIITGSITLFITLIITNDISFSGHHFDTFFSSNAYGSNIYQKINNNFQLFLPILLLIFIIPFIWFFLKKTTTGLRIRATGLNFKISKLSGINPEKYQYIAVMSGVFLMTIASWFFAEWNGKFSGSVSGFGYLGLAIMLLGKGNVLLISIFALMISSLTHFATKISSLEPNIWIKESDKDDLRRFYSSLENVFNAFIYIIPLFILVIYEIIAKYKKKLLQKKLSNI